MQKFLYGDCIEGPASTSVRISSLDDTSCSFEADPAATQDTAQFSGPLALWIGAIGPLRATATRIGASQYLARFIEPLDGKIVQHFKGC